MYSPGELPQRYLDVNFFANEAKQLQLTPTLTQQMRELAQRLVGKFEDDVNATSEGFITFLQQASEVSGKDIMAGLTKTQGTIDKAFQNLIDDMQTQMLQIAGPKYESAIKKLVQDVQSQLEPSIDLETKIRSNPELDQKLPPRSIFDLAAEPPKGEASPD